jgi:hypothetical protein
MTKQILKQFYKNSGLRSQQILMGLPRGFIVDDLTVAIYCHDSTWAVWVVLDHEGTIQYQFHPSRET